MSSRLPPLAGAPPVKVVFGGVEPRSVAAQLLLAQYRGEIARFHFKARNAAEFARLTGEDASTYMQQALPAGDGQLRFGSVFGQETIYISLNPKVVQSVTEERKSSQSSFPFKPTLAIDVLFDSESYDAVRYDFGIDTNVDPEKVWAIQYVYSWTRIFPVVVVHRNPKNTPSFGVFGASNTEGIFRDNLAFGAVRSLAGALSGPSPFQLSELRLPQPSNDATVAAPAPPLTELTAEERVAVGFAVQAEFPGQRMEFDIYVGSNNFVLNANYRPNLRPTGVPITWPGWEVEFRRKAIYRLQVRGFRGDLPLRQIDDVKQNLVNAAFTELYDTRNPEAYPGPFLRGNLPPSGFTGYELLDQRVGLLLADRNWAYDGQNPANPRAAGMGELLARTSKITRDVAIPAPGSLPVEDSEQLWNLAPWWSEELNDLTKVATLVWESPSDGRLGVGKVQLTPV